MLNLWDKDPDSVKKGVKMNTATHAPKGRECMKKEGPNVKKGLSPMGSTIHSHINKFFRVPGSPRLPV